MRAIGGSKALRVNERSGMQSCKVLAMPLDASLIAMGMLTMAAPVSMSGQMSGPRYLREVDRVCNKVLPDGTTYERWDRVFLTTWEGKPLYVKVRAYYKPGSGEFLWVSTGLSEHGYRSELQEST